jgi:phage shock protein PspC (stress-responsive transcriptional regulator)
MSSLLGEFVVDEEVVRLAYILLLVVGMVVAVWVVVRWRPSRE